MSHDDTTPATKGDVKALSNRVDNLTLRVDGLSLNMKALEKLVTDEGEKTRRHIEVIAEHNSTELLGANRDEILVLQDSRANHDERITTLERKIGLIPA